MRTNLKIKKKKKSFPFSVLICNTKCKREQMAENLKFRKIQKFVSKIFKILPVRCVTQRLVISACFLTLGEEFLALFTHLAWSMVNIGHGNFCPVCCGSCALHFHRASESKESPIIQFFAIIAN